MNYSSPFCPDDTEVFTSNGKMKISKLYYKMNPKRDPYNRILDIQNLFLTKCIVGNIEKDEEIHKTIKDKNLKELKDINDYYNTIIPKNKYKSDENNKFQLALNQEEVPYFNDYSTIFQTSIKVNNNTNYKNKNMSCSENKINNSKINRDNSNKGNSNIKNNSLYNYDQSKSDFNKPKILNHSHSYVVKLDKTYYKNPTLNKKIYVLNHKNKIINNSSRFSYSNNSTYFNDSDMAKLSEYMSFAKQNYLNGQFDFDLSKTKELRQLKQYQIKEIQNRNKAKPFVY